MFPLLLTIVKDLEKEEDEDDQEKVLMTAITMWLWGKRVVDRGYIIMYKAICDNCSGNGHINISNSKGVTEPKQCWMCNSEGEIKYEEDFINKLIINHHHRLH